VRRVKQLAVQKRKPTGQRRGGANISGKGQARVRGKMAAG